ncbi:MAG TPA: hypothetical protein VK582_09345 [Pyrinomonadaceae bacterium]|nr:hypothetical protein [Pyrinomonadaceae bacterium]
MKVKSLQAAKPATAKSAWSSCANAKRVRGFAGNHTRIKAQTAAEQSQRQDDDAKHVGRDEKNEQSFPRRISYEGEASAMPVAPRANPVRTVEHHRHRFSASIRRVEEPKPASLGSYAAAAARGAINLGRGPYQNDATPGNEQTTEIDMASTLAQTVVPDAGSIREPEDGETVQLPDIVMPATAVIEQTDPIASALTYNSSITQSGAKPSPFGATLPYTHALSGISVTLTAGTYQVAATVDNPITFQVDGGTRPDISSDTDADITKTNYPTVVSDLTPNLTDLKGRPPRNSFWAEDLTIKHENFHATEDVKYGGSGTTLAQNWLNTQTAGSVAAVNALLGQVPAKVAATVSAAMAYPGREERAYDDGAPSYQARADAIKKKGDAAGYP